MSAPGNRETEEDMAKRRCIKIGDIVYYNRVRMPHYQGVTGSTCRLTRDWRIGITLPDGLIVNITVKAGFIFDGASIPRALWRVCGHPLEAPRIAAALAHDWLYAAHVCDRKTADLIYRTILCVVGFAPWRATIEYAALRLAGGAAWRSHGADDEKFALAHGALAIEEKIKE